MTPRYYLACDLGAESGRVMLGCLEDGRLTLEEIHRFANGYAVSIMGSMRWDVLRIFDELKTGLRKAGCARVAGGERERGLLGRRLRVDQRGRTRCLHRRSSTGTRARTRLTRA